MTLDQLRVFVAVATHMHVTQAARGLNMTQSAASASLAALEARCGVKLFHRIGRRIELSGPGVAFLAEAKAVLNRAAEAERALSELVGLERGRLELYASQTIGGYWLPPKLHRFRQLYPQIELQLAIGNTAQVAEAVQRGEASLGFVEGEIAYPGLTRLPIAGDDLRLVVGADHPWADGRVVKPENLPETPWVLRETGSGTRQMFESALVGYRVAPDSLNIAFELPSNEAVRSAVEAGAGATVISDLVAQASLGAGLLRAVDLPFPKRRFFVVRHMERQRGKAEAALVELLKT